MLDLGDRADDYPQRLNDRYELVRPLGSGSMGNVFEGRHLELDMPVAIKFMRPDWFERPLARKRFMKEARALARLRSPFVVKVNDVGTCAKGPFIVMELLEGEDLQRLIEREGALDIPRAARLIRQVCAGIAAAHALGIVHRDIKPANLYVVSDSDVGETCKLFDFGVAKSEDRSTITVSGSLVGTIRYMSPEQARGQTVGPPSDVHALGAVLYELSTGVPAFGATCEQVTLFQIMNELPTPAHRVRPDVPEWMSQLIQRALSKEPEERPSAREMGKALERYDNESSAEPVARARIGRVTVPEAATWVEPGGSVPTLDRSQLPEVSGGGKTASAFARRLKLLTLALAAGLGVLLGIAFTNRPKASSEVERAPASVPPLTRPTPVDAVSVSGRSSEWEVSPAPTTPRAGTDPLEAATSARSRTGGPNALYNPAPPQLHPVGFERLRPAKADGSAAPRHDALTDSGSGTPGSWLASESPPKVKSAAGAGAYIRQNPYGEPESSP